MSDVESLDYSDYTSGSKSSSRSNSRNSTRSDRDKPLWSNKRSKSRSASPKKRKRSPIRAPTQSPPSRNRRERTRSPPRRRRQSRSPIRRRSRSRSVRRSPRSPTNWRRSPKNSPPRRNYRRQRSRSRSNSPMDRKEREEKQREEMWMKRREKRNKIQHSGEINVWGMSPTQKQIQETYKLEEEAEEATRENEKKGKALKADRDKAKRKEERKRKNISDQSSSSDDSDSDSEDEKRKKKKKKSKKSKKSSKKQKKEKKKPKKLEIKKGESSDEWEERPTDYVESGDRREGSYSPGPAIPDHIKARNDLKESLNSQVTSYGKDLLKGEGEGMAAYAARGERIPRRGEIGLSSGEIEQYEKWGYVMSGSRHKAMEATRLRKENQILTAEEKRLLSGVSVEAKKKKEEVVLDQFRTLIKNKNMRS